MPWVAGVSRKPLNSNDTALPPMTTLFCDTETYSAVNLRIHGTHRYADGVEVMLFLYAIDDGPVECWDLTTGAPMPKELANPLHNPSVELVFPEQPLRPHRVAQGAGHSFARSAASTTRWCRPWCTHSPGGLERIGQIIGLTESRPKQKAGKKLIQLFCVPQGKNKDRARHADYTRTVGGVHQLRRQ